MKGVIGWLRRGHLEINQKEWMRSLVKISVDEQVQFRRKFDRLRENFLDRCEGTCPLRDPNISRIVADALMHFDGSRYSMGDFIIMPNHVHFLVAFPTEDAMQKQCVSWMHYTARHINQRLGSKGRFWQSDPFDHLVRNPTQYDYLRKYIQDNPKKAGLKPGEFLYQCSNS